MKKRILIATFVGAIITLIWSIVSLSYLTWHTPKTFANSAEITKVIQDNTNGHGMYALSPLLIDVNPDKEATKSHPFIYAIIRPQQIDGRSMIRPLVLNFGANLFLALILAIIMARRSHYISKLVVGLLFGLFAGITASAPLFIWMELPNMETIARLCDPLISWTFAAAIMGLIVKKTKRRIFSS